MKSESSKLLEKYKKKDSDVDLLRKEIKSKGEVIQNLEQQVECIPLLKNKIKDLERQASYELSKSTSYQHSLKVLNSANRDIDQNKTLNSANVT